MKNKYLKLILKLVTCCFLILGFLTSAQIVLASQPNLDLQVPIFGYTKATNIAEYIGKIFEFALVIIIPVAIIIIMWGGFLWVLSRGNPPVIKMAKTYISSAILGLILAALSYIILSFIGLTTLTLPGIERIQSIETGGDVFVLLPLDFDVSTVAPGDSYCPKSGGAQEIQKIAQGTLGKVTYRMGGKPNTKAPYSPSSEIMNCGDRKCYTFCPEGQLCLDCSGYMSYLYLCAGLQSPPSFTGAIFATCTHINSYTATSVNGTELKPGDLVGYPPTGCGQKIGHVLIYIGGGKIAESHGGGGMENANSGRKPGNAIIISDFTKFAGKHSPCGCIRKIQ